MTDTGPVPRARFAPSPTGYFHVGSARAALYNWLFVRRLGGTFILRIEDTDEARNRPEWTDGIISALDWLGMSPDEGPFFQSAQGEALSSGGFFRETLHQSLNNIVQVSLSRFS